MADALQAPAPVAAPSSATPAPPFPFKPAAAEPSLSGVDPAEAQAFAIADSLIRHGVDPERVKAAIAPDYPNWNREQRSPEQIRHDQQHGIEPYVTEKAFTYVLPAGGLGEGFDQGAIAKLDGDVRYVAAELQLDPNAGARLITNILGNILAANRLDEAGRAAAAERTETQLRAVFPGEKFDQAVAAVNELVDRLEHKNPQFAAALKFGGLLCTPTLFAQLYHRSRSLAAWRDSRPSKGLTP